MKYPSTLKQDLHKLCLLFVDQRIENAQQALKNAQDSANTEEKSSAGDKYETGRAMAQIERDKAAQQLNEALKLKSVLDKITPGLSQSIGLGSVIITNSGNFYLSISAGKMSVGGIDFIALSSVSPIGAMLFNKKVGEKIIFNKQSFEIKDIL
jgi:transcription elongation GreA/GreB family factor